MLKVFNPFYATSLYLYHQKTSENLWFSDLSGVAKKGQWHEMVYFSGSVLKMIEEAFYFI